MLVSEKINRIAKAWGAETTGYTVEGALENLADNLPFGTKTEMVEFLKETTISTVVEYEEDTYAWSANELHFFNKKPIANNEYIVAFDGTEYRCKAVEDGNDYIWFGNGSIWGEDYENTGEPFAVDWSSGQMSLSTAVAGTHTISVVGEKIATINPDYLPTGEALGKAYVVYGAYDNDDNFVFSKTSDEMMELIGQGYNLYLKVSGIPPIPACSAHGNFAAFAHITNNFSDAGLSLNVTVYQNIGDTVSVKYGKITATVED